MRLARQAQPLAAITHRRFDHRLNNKLPLIHPTTPYHWPTTLSRFIRLSKCSIGVRRGYHSRSAQCSFQPQGKSRKFKFDEIPQFYNILRGEMSVVGPRPKLPRYTEISNMPYRPGITGPATIAFCREEEILRNVDLRNIDLFYAEHIKPLKACLDVCYMCRATPLSDLRIILATAFHRMRSQPPPNRTEHEGRG